MDAEKDDSNKKKILIGKWKYILRFVTKYYLLDNCNKGRNWKIPPAKSCAVLLPLKAAESDFGIKIDIE